MTLRNALLAALFTFIAAGIIFPNPYGNNPDIVGDESYFLSTALFSIEKLTLPGWEFSASGAYYGGPQTYVDTTVLIPVLGMVVAASHFSIATAKVWAALNTGELLHVLRLVNGVAALAALIFLFFYFKKKKIPRELALTLTLFLFLLLSNVIVIEFLHTAKMWVFYIISVAAMSALFIAQEYYLSGAAEGKFPRRGLPERSEFRSSGNFPSAANEPFIKKDTYVTLWVWIGILTFFQSWVGVFSIALLALYALILKHFSIRDVWNHVLKYWYLILLFSATQIGFVWRLFSILGIFSGISTRTPEGALDWSARLIQPITFALETQPLILLYPLAAIALGLLMYRKSSQAAISRRNLLILIALLHPLLTYLIFHVGIGFDVGPRYAIFLGMASALSIAILLSEIGARAVVSALILTMVWFAILNVHAIRLFWTPSSETVLLNTIMEKYNSPDNVFVVDWSAKRLTLPINYESLPYQGETRLEMGRFQFLLENRELLPKDPAFKPLAFTVYTKEEEDTYVKKFKKSHSVWIVQRNCDTRCMPAEIEAGSCFELHLEACVISPQDTNALPEFLSSNQLGNSYIVRKIN